MPEQSTVTPAQILRMAKQLKAAQGTAGEATQLEQLAQKGLSDEQQAQLHGLMQDKAKLQELLQSPQAQQLMRKLGGKQAE